MYRIEKLDSNPKQGVVRRLGIELIPTILGNGSVIKVEHRAHGFVTVTFSRTEQVRLYICLMMMNQK